VTTSGYRTASQPDPYLARLHIPTASRSKLCKFVAEDAFINMIIRSQMSGLSDRVEDLQHLEEAGYVILRRNRYLF
jgi:hypothetical protein